MSNNYALCFNAINFVVIPSYIELSWSEEVTEKFVQETKSELILLILFQKVRP